MFFSQTYVVFNLMGRDEHGVKTVLYLGGFRRHTRSAVRYYKLIIITKKYDIFVFPSKHYSALWCYVGVVGIAGNL